MHILTDFEKITLVLVEISVATKFNKFLESHKQEIIVFLDAVSIKYEVEDIKPGTFRIKEITSDGSEITEVHDIDSELEQKFHNSLKTFPEFLKSYEKEVLTVRLGVMKESLILALERVQSEPSYKKFPKYRTCLSKLHQHVNSAYNDIKISPTTNRESKHISNKKRILSGNAQKKLEEKQQRKEEHWPKIIDAAHKTLEDKPLEDFKTPSGNASSKLYSDVYRKYKGVPKDSLRKWLDEAIKSGQLQDDLKKLTKADHCLTKD